MKSEQMYCIANYEIKYLLYKSGVFTTRWGPSKMQFLHT